MLPVVKNDSRATARAILIGAALLIAATVLPFLWNLAGKIYLASALLFGGILLWICLRLWKPGMVPSSPFSKKYARELLRATVLYLPLLFMVMMLDRL